VDGSAGRVRVINVRLAEPVRDISTSGSSHGDFPPVHFAVLLGVVSISSHRQIRSFAKPLSGQRAMLTTTSAPFSGASFGSPRPAELLHEPDRIGDEVNPDEFGSCSAKRIGADKIPSCVVGLQVHDDSVCQPPWTMSTGELVESWGAICLDPGFQT